MKFRRYVLPTLLWLIMIVALAQLVDRFPPVERWWGFLTPDRVEALVYFAVLFALATMLRAARFGNLIKRSVPVGWPAILTAYPWLFMLGALTPFRIGEGWRAVWVRKFGGSSGEAIGYMVGERVTDFLILLIWGMLGLALAPTASELTIWFPAAALVITVVGFAAATIMGPRFATHAQRHPRLVKFGIPKLIMATGFMRERGAGTAAFSLSVAIWLTMDLAFVVAFGAMLGIYSIGCASLSIAAVNLIRIISPAPGNIGSYQAAMVAALLVYGVSAEDGLIVAVLMQVTMLTVLVCQGILARLVSIGFGLEKLETS